MALSLRNWTKFTGIPQQADSEAKARSFLGN
jgi:hypothetical protein